MMAFIEQAMEQSGSQWEDPYEWERMDLKGISAIALAPEDEREPLVGLPPPVMPDWSRLLDWDPCKQSKVLRHTKSKA
jgi:hypothetical protein